MNKFFFHIIFLLPPIFLFGQIEPIRNFSVKDGLPSGIVYDCLQDKQGFMWFATAAGLARFDGSNFKVFTTKDGLTNNEVLQIALDKDGSIWILPFGFAACIYDPSTQKLYNETNYEELRKLKNGAIQLLLRNTAAGLMVFAAEKSFILENKKAKELDTRAAYDLWPLNKDSMVFMGNPRSYFLLTKQKKEEIKFSPIDSSMDFAKSLDWGRWKIFINSNPAIKFNLYQFTDEGSIKKMNDFTSQYPVNNISKYGPKIYMATVSGVYITDTMLSTKEYFFHGKNISRVFVDRNGNEWFCSLSGEGIYMRLKNEVLQYDIHSALPDDNVSVVTMTGNGKLMCGDDKGNIYTLDLSKKNAKPIISWKLPERIRNIEMFGNSVIAYSNYRLVIDGKNIPGDFGAMKCVLPDDSGNLLIGSHWYLYRYSPQKDQREKIKASQRFVTLSILKNQLYYGNNEGLFKIRSLTPYTEDIIEDRSKILRKPINHLLATGDGILWVATNTDGVVALKNEKLIGHFNMSSAQSLTSNICKKLFYDRQENSIWVATNKGVNKISYRLSGDSLTAIANSITSSEGLNDDDVNDIYVKDRKVFAATIKGICVFNSELLKEQVPVRITDISIKDYPLADSSYSIKKEYTLNYHQNNLSISYTGICFTCNNKLVYQYRMIGPGNDTTWNTTAATTVEFNGLQKGNYSFQVKTGGSNIEELTFYIKPAFWETTWFYAILVFCITGVFFLIIKFVAHQIRKRETQKTNINKKFAELEFQALQAQMNPHFVFNAMSTLQNYILKNESENANEYLAKFARLMRLFLESSRNKFIELRNEIELLSNYIELEQARLEDKFQYRINVHPDVEMDTKIPSVIIQPFVENAILHGLRYKDDGSGLLELNFRATDNFLECQVKDNGIGREKSASINKSKYKLYKSQALNIIDEKIKTLRQINNVNIKITTEDNADQNGESKGTTVTIQFGVNS